MRIVISSGHGLHIRGASGYIDEVDEARRVVAAVADELAKLGVAVTEFHDDVSTTQNENLDRIVDFHNSQERDLDVSVHFNAYQTTAEPRGTECLFLSEDLLAEDLSAAVAAAGSLVDRGAKFRDDLAFLNRTERPAVLIETCFVDSQSDVDAYRAHFPAICQAIADALTEREEESVVLRETVQQGDSGADVVAIQETLGLPVDGQFGPVTDAAVRSFQGAVGLAKDGVVGAQTWQDLDELDERVADGTDGISPPVAVAVDDLVENSGLYHITWRDRGAAPPGYYSGMAKTFALAVQLLQGGDPAATIMAEAAGNPDSDALAWCAAEFAEAGMSNDVAGLDALRHLFTFMVGLGMRESSGNCWAGRDLSVENVQAETAESGLFQASWNLHTCAEEIESLLDEYREDPNGFGDTFRVGIRPTEHDLDCYGSGDGAFYQWLAKFSPAFAVLMTAIGLRRRKDHWGPVKRHEVEIRTDVDAVLAEVQKLASE